MPLNALQQRIIEYIQRSGPMTFAEYMRMALYEPDYGYYVSGPARIGWEGDYYTSTTVSDFFAHCMGRQLYQMWEQLGCPSPFTVLEQGAGEGHLARGVRTWAAQERPDFSAILDYRIEDIRTGQDVRNQPLTAPQGEQTQRPYVILSNELVDAFPVHLVEVRDGKLYEVYVTTHDDLLDEILLEPSSDEVAHYLDEYHVPWTTFEDGWRAEINLDALRWMARAANLLPTASPHSRKKHGFLITIDYGEKARELYTRERRSGTLTSYFRHQLTNRPLVQPGEQDITAHVNFSALIQEGRRHSLRLQSFTTQRLWLDEQGIYDELERLRARDFAVIDTARASDQGQVALFQWYNVRQQVAALTETSGMGNFKVLILRR